MSIVEKTAQALGITVEELKEALLKEGFKQKAVKVESPEVIAARQELDKFLATKIEFPLPESIRTMGDVVAYADHLRAEFKELKPRQVSENLKPYEQSEGFKTVIIQLNPENAQKAGHPIAVLEIEGSSNWRRVMQANGYTLGQVGMVSKGHRDHATARNGFVGNGNLNKYGLFAQLTAEQVEQVELSQKTQTAVNAPQEASQ